MKKTLSLLLAFVCLSNMFQPAFAENQVIIMNDNGNQPIKIEGPQPFINEQNRTLIPLSWVDNVLKSKVTYEQNENQIVMKQFGLETDTILKFECGNPILYRNDTEEILMDTSPCSMDGVIYLPLRSMAEALNHSIYWDEVFNSITLYYYAAEIYIWSADPKFGDTSARYALFQEEPKEQNDIFARGTNRIEDITEELSKLSKGNLIVYTLYRTKDYKIPRKVFDTIYSAIADSTELKISYSKINLDIVPPIIQGSGDFTDAWFSEQLFALGESDLRDNPKEAYRFTYIPAFFEPYTIRLEIDKEGNGRLFYSKCDAPISSSGGDIAKQAEKEMSKSDCSKLLTTIKQYDFWTLPMTDERIGLDGSEWLIEGVKNGKYHFIYRWSPKEGAAFEIGKSFMEASESIFSEP